MNSQRILILGASGMLGHVLFRKLSERPEFEVHATCRNRSAIEPHFPPALLARVRHGVIADDFASLREAIREVRPSVVVNCIGIVKQLAEADDPLVAIPVNALLPHLLAKACGESGARLVHVSTDCVFTGKKGSYTEDDPSDADDLYGRSKRLGEVTAPGAVTLRTSIIGHELSARHGLLEWFLAQQGPVRGFARAIFTGFPTVELARIVAERVIPDPGLTGLYHVSSEPVSKYDLLKLFAEAYGKQNEIVRDESFSCDRSLDSGRFREATGYRPPSWPDLVRAMHEDAVRSYKKGTVA